MILRIWVVWIGAVLSLPGGTAVATTPVPHESAQWSHAARSLMAQAAQDPQTTERRLYQHLDTLGEPPYLPATTAVLERLQDWPVHQTHIDPERHGRQVPRYPVAWQARRALRLQAAQASAGRAQAAWQQGVERYVQGLRDEAAVEPWLALLQSPGPCMDDRLQRALAGCVRTHRSCADAVVTCAAHADPATLQEALLRAEPARVVMQAQRSDWPLAVAALPGVATQRQLRHANKGGSAAELDLLGDPLRGADAAVVLAERLDAASLQALRVAFLHPHSSTLLRQRILLVLRLTPLPQAAAQQQAWLQALGATDPALQRSVASW